MKGMMIKHKWLRAIATALCCVLIAATTAGCMLGDDYSTLRKKAFGITVEFNANGGSGKAPSAITVIGKGRNITLPGASGLSRNGYVFGGWNTSASGAGTNYDAGSSYRVTEDITLYARWDSISWEMVWVEGGSFQMGTPDDYYGSGNNNERPVHTVTLASFYMGKNEVTQAQWYAVMRTNPSSSNSNYYDGNSNYIVAGVGNSYPVYNVSWHDAVEFCNALSEQEGLTPVYTSYGYGGTTVAVDWDANGYRLPTEAEWEYAAKGGRGSPGNYTYAGSDTVDGVAWYDGNSSGYDSNYNYYNNSAKPVGTKSPNRLGLYDMSGNVWEWCWDWYGDYTSEEKIDPEGASSGSYRVMRGGSYYNAAEFVRSAYRGSGDPSSKNAYTGFRIVRSEDTSQFTVRLDANGGSGTVPSFQTVSAGDSTTLPGGGSGSLSKDGYTFGGWNTRADGTGTNYDAGSLYTPAGSITLYARWDINPVEMVWIEGGSFQMGKNLGTGYGSDVTPVHTVTLTGFSMSKYEVTQAQYEAVMGTNPSSDSDSYNNNYGVGGGYPVYYVSWYDALVFCNKLSVAEGLTPAYRISNSTDPSDWGSVPTSSNSTWNAVEVVDGSNGYRLPTEAQWEYAAKGGNTGETFTYSGSDTVGDVAWYTSNSNSTTHTVGTKAANGLGFYDMSGNVWEWCWDWYGSYSSEEQTDPKGLSSGSYRVIRGGDWINSAEYVRSVYRGNYNPSNRDYYIGCRLVRPDISEYTVTFNLNGGGGTTPSAETANAGSSITLPGGLSKNGSIFGGWNTQADSMGTNYAASSSYTLIGNITLYAKWVSVPELVFVPGGNFQMGKNLGTGSYSDVTPVHTVTLTGFAIGKYEVTQAQYEAVMGSLPGNITTATGKGDNYPVYYVSWYDALVFCNKLSEAEGLTPAYRINYSTDPSAWGTIPTYSDSTWNAVEVVSGSTGYRLPTEAQWEYAAKGGNGETYTYSGSDTVGNVAWYSGNSNSTSHEVGTKAPNALGLYDMSGNVLEWCRDWYGSYSSGAQTDPMGASSGSYRVLRGGYWYNSADSVRSVYRNSDSPNYRDNNTGFRLVRPDTSEYTVTFSLNGGGGTTPSAETVSAGSSITLPSGLSRTGYIFGGWNTQANGTGTNYSGASYTVIGTITLYAKWIEGVVSSSGVELIRVAGGSFQMGKNLGTVNYGDTTPVHTVTVSGFYMGRYEVTQAQYQAVMGSLPSQLTTGTNYGRGNNYPVYYVNWYDALVFCNKLSMTDGLTPAYSISGSTDPAVWGTVPTSSNSTWNGVTIISGSTGYRLPTEAQWEYAAKGGNTGETYTYSGSDTVGDVAWYDGNNSPYGSKPVGTKAANGLGLYDMSGNVWEWCWDWYASYSSEAQTDPMGASSGSDRVLRGGYWDNSAGYVRSVYRGYSYPYSRNYYYGIRLARPAQ